MESGADAETQVMQAELEHNIQEAINLLPPKCRVVFQLSRFEELSYQEIADKLFVSVKTVNTYRYRIFEKLNIDSDVKLTHLAMRYGLIKP